MANGTEIEPVEKIAPSERPLAMIGLPARGQQEAIPWIVGGVLFYAVVAVVFFYSLLAGDNAATTSLLDTIGLGETPNPSIAVLVITGILVTGAAGISVLRDLREIRSEESDIEWLSLHGAKYAQLVLAPAEQREKLRQRDQRTVPAADRRVETLVDDRVRRMMSVQDSARSTMVPVEELRIIAQTRTARLGGFARYASSLLLLLAVLGTFAGVKTALPSLIDAVSASSQLGDASAPISIVDPLRAVADAFGANALALIGAIAIGLMAHGISVGRRNLLERLELVSAEYIYGTRQMDSTDPLRTAVEAMRDTVAQVRETSGFLLGIENGLTSLGQEFAGAFESLDDRLTAIIEQQDKRLHERTSHALEELRERVAEMAVVVDANTRAYAGLVARIGEKSEEAQHAIQQLEIANQRLASGLEGAANLTGVAQEAGEAVTASIGRIEAGTAQVQQQVASLSVAVSTVGPSLEQVGTVLATASQQIGDLSTRTAQALEDVNSRAATSWVTAGREMEQHIARLAAGNGRSSSPAALGTDATQLLRQIAASLDGRSSQMSTTRLVLLPTLGVVIGGIVLYVLYAFSRSDFIVWLLGLAGLS